MRLSDIMSQMGLASYAEVGLMLFFLIFLCVGVYVFRTSREQANALARIPLEDAPVQPRTTHLADKSET